MFAILHIFAFTYKPYYDPPNDTPRFRSLLHAMNFNETIKELWIGMRYGLDRLRGRETDMMARRDAVREDLFGWSKWEMKGRMTEKKPETSGVRINVEEMVHLDSERQWLGVGNDYGYGLGYHSRRVQERSDPLEEQINKELSAREVGKRCKS